MKKLTVLLALIVSTYSLSADDVPAEKPKIRLQMEIAKSEVEGLGLSVEALQTELTKELTQSNILIQDDSKNPLLVLRLKTVTQDTTVATFIQLAFFEDAELARNKMTVLAMTWSQASLLSTAKEDFTKEVTKCVLSMTSSFVTDYEKAFSASLSR